MSCSVAFILKQFQHLIVPGVRWTTSLIVKDQHILFRDQVIPSFHLGNQWIKEETVQPHITRLVLPLMHCYGHWVMLGYSSQAMRSLMDKLNSPSGCSVDSVVTQAARWRHSAHERVEVPKDTSLQEHLLLSQWTARGHTATPSCSPPPVGVSYSPSICCFPSGQLRSCCPAPFSTCRG